MHGWLLTHGVPTPAGGTFIMSSGVLCFTNSKLYHVILYLIILGEFGYEDIPSNDCCRRHGFACRAHQTLKTDWLVWSSHGLHGVEELLELVN